MVPIKRKGAKGTKHPGITKLSDGRYLVLRTWIDPKTGRRIYRRRVVTGSLDDAHAARAELREQEQSARERSRPRFKTFAEEWLRRHRRKLTGSTLERYTVDVAHLAVQFGDWWVDAIDFDTVDKWQAEVSSQYAGATI